MLKRFGNLLLLSAALFPTMAHAWGTEGYVQPGLQSPPSLISKPETSFPLNADQEWSLKPSLLVWKPYQDDIDSGYTEVISSVLPAVAKNKTQNIDFNWGTGVRITLGKYLPHHEQWDVLLASTYLYSDADKKIHGKLGSSGLSSISISQLKLITNGWNPSLLGISFDTDVNWKINYFTWDLSLGRLYSLTSKFVIHPFIALRSVLIYEKYRIRNNSTAVSSSGSLVPHKTTFKTTDSVWGVGPRLGSDFSYSFGKGWSFLGGLSGAVVMGRYNLKETIDGFLLGSGTSRSVDTDFKLRDADTVMHANLEGSIGLGWEKWVRKHTVRIAPSFLFEATQWFLINNWSATNLAANPFSGSFPDWGMLSQRRMGDLGFLGFTVNLQLDF
jgi:hypothetical protein